MGDGQTKKKTFAVSAGRNIMCGDDKQSERTGCARPRIVVELWRSVRTRMGGLGEVRRVTSIFQSFIDRRQFEYVYDKQSEMSIL